MRVRILGGVLALAVALMLFVVWKTRPQTKYAAGFSEAGFSAIQPGETEADVMQRLGKPLTTYSEETVEEWCFGTGTAEPSQGQHWIGRVLGWPSEAACLYLKDGVVVSVRSSGGSRLAQLQGKTADEVAREMGKPKYIVPAGMKVTLRYSEPRQPTDSYEAFLVILDGERVVRGTKHFVYLD
ncbi:hypothetical protein [Corallococcus macrosporus]|nr:hypothetical protein [Corallococcus macrosporus]